jgi:hypothetical protein
VTDELTWGEKWGYSFRGRLVGLCAVLLLFAPWWAMGRTELRGVDLLVEHLRAFAGTVGAVYREDLRGQDAVWLLYSRRATVALVAVASGALLLLLVPRGRFPRLPFVGSVLLTGGMASFFVREIVLTFVFNLGIADPKAPSMAFFVAADLIACVPLLMGLAAVELARRWDERALLVGAALAFACFFCFIGFGHAAMCWGVRFESLAAILAFGSEAWQWDELPRESDA